MDINALASEFGSAGVSPDTGNTSVDVHGLAAEFGSKKKADEIAKDVKSGAITIRPVAPPISGDTSPLPQPEVTQAGGVNPRDLLPQTNIQESAYNADLAGKDLTSSGVSDFETGHPYVGAAKVAGGLLSRLASPMTGIVQGGVNTPVTDITGNPDIGDRAAFVAGSALPVVPGAGAIVKALPKNAALSSLIESIGAKDLPSVVSQMKANPRLTPADLSPRVLQDTQNLFATEGPHINYLKETSDKRLSTAKDTVNSAFDSAMGPTVNAAQKIDQLKAAARKVGKEQIEPFLQANPHTDITDLVKHIDSEIGYPAMKAIKAGERPPLPLTDYQRELLNVRNKLRNPAWPNRDQMFAYTDQVHSAQSKLREKAQGLASSATGSERNTASDLFKFREKIKAAVGPEYKKVLGKYADEKQIDEAFHYGHDTILKNGKTLENDPSFFEKWINDPKRKPDELEAAMEGARRAINAEIQGTRSAATNPASKGVAIGQVDFNRQRLEYLLGKQEADKLLTTLEHTRLEANTHNKIFEGSQTAMRTSSKAKFTLPTKTDVMKAAPAVAAMEASNFYMGGFPGFGTALMVGAKAGNSVKDSVKLALAKEHNAQYAKIALPTEGPSRDALIKSLEAAIPGPKQSIVRRGAGTLSRLVAP